MNDLILNVGGPERLFRQRRRRLRGSFVVENLMRMCRGAFESDIPCRGNRNCLPVSPWGEVSFRERCFRSGFIASLDELVANAPYVVWDREDILSSAAL